MNPTPLPPDASAPIKYTLDMYNNLKAALATGARQIQYGDQIIQFQNPQAMRDQLALMELELGIRSAVRRSYPGYNKGLL